MFMEWIELLEKFLLDSKKKGHHLMAQILNAYLRFNYCTLPVTWK